ncbi:MAG: hypothetical protein LC627_02360, partial [Verrucomicrobiaceae bacterium]|nr:hypothetical protein [Verrucomicrobiaceae bacterium]
MSSAYRVAPVFLIRMAGVPFDVVERLGTPDSISLARRLVQGLDQRERAAADAEKFFNSREQLLTQEAYNALHLAVRTGRPVTPVPGEQQPAVFANYAESAAAVALLELELDQALEREVQAARTALWAASCRFLPSYLVFSAEGVSGVLAEELARFPGDEHVLPMRNNAARKIEQTLLLYLQRIATKNDTFSAFGPSGWGRIDNIRDRLSLAPKAGIAARDVFLERWVAHTVAAVINADPQVGAELRLSVLALEPHAFEVLHKDVSNWPNSQARERWLPVLSNIVDLARGFGATMEPEKRREIISAARDKLETLGATRKSGGRFLYSAVNPIGEECFRECDFVISQDLIGEIAHDAAPWIDLWRDIYAFVASRVAAGLRQILEIS